MKIFDKRHFMIGAQRWCMMLVDAIPKRHCKKGEEPYGLCLPKKCQIYVVMGPEDVIRDTTLHELLHALLAVSGVGDNVLHGKQEETVVMTLAPALDALLDWKIRESK